jgi:serine/threonine protein phosphatase PrpC
MRFAVFQDSVKGGRPSNQDRIGYSYSREALILILADGMGGHVQGEVAAEIAVRVIMSRFERAAKPTIRKPVDFLNEALMAAHRAIEDYAFEHGMFESPRTTCVACLVQNDHAWWAHAGDSRLYLFRRGALLAQTRDHSRVQHLIDAGIISAKAAADHPERNKIYSCLGGSITPQIDVSPETPLRKGDTFVLSSDGFWAQLAQEEIADAVKSVSVLNAMPNLMKLAAARGGMTSDNISVVAVTWENPEFADEVSTISTETMPLDVVTTQLSGPLSERRGGSDDVTDAEIEKAILEIQEAIRRYGKDNGN